MSCARLFSLLLFTNILSYSKLLRNIRRAENSSAFALLLSLIIEFMNIFNKICQYFNTSTLFLIFAYVFLRSSLKYCESGGTKLIILNLVPRRL